MIQIMSLVMYKHLLMSLKTDSQKKKNQEKKNQKKYQTELEDKIKEKEEESHKKIKELEAKVKELEDKCKNPTTNQITNNFGKIIMKN